MAKDVENGRINRIDSFERNNQDDKNDEDGQIERFHKDEKNDQIERIHKDERNSQLDRIRKIEEKDKDDEIDWNHCKR